MRLLIVSEAYAPAQHAEAFCTTRFAQALASAGVEVVVVTRAGSHIRRGATDASPRWSRPDGVRVVRVGTPGRLVRHASDVFARLRTGVVGLKGWHRAAGTAALAEHAARPFDLVMTRHVSERTAWIGERLRRAGVPWVAQFSDPAPLCLHAPPFAPGAPRTRSERSVIAGLRRRLSVADAVAWPCERLTRYHQRLLGVAARRTIVVPHVGGVDDFVPVPSPRSADGRRELRVLHAGLWVDGRFPEALLLAVADAADHARSRGVRLVLEVLGAPPDRLRVPIPERTRGVFEFSGIATYDDALAAMRGADALLLSEVPLNEGVYLPTKLGDYATARRPVLAWSPRDGTVADRLGAAHPGFLGQDREGARLGFTRLVDAFLDAPSGLASSWLVPRPEAFEASAVAAGFLRDVVPILRSPAAATG